jgi:hypothetical protein
MRFPASFGQNNTRLMADVGTCRFGPSFGWSPCHSASAHDGSLIVLRMVATPEFNPSFSLRPTVSVLTMAHFSTRCRFCLYCHGLLRRLNQSIKLLAKGDVVGYWVLSANCPPNRRRKKIRCGLQCVSAEIRRPSQYRICARKFY